MNFLKLKSILFGLIAVFAVTALLTSCEKETLNDFEEEVTLQEVESKVAKSVEEFSEENIESRGCKSISWRSRPSSIKSGSNYMSVNFCIDRPGKIIAQIFNCNWTQIGEYSVNVASGASGTIHLYPQASNLCYYSNNHIQVKLTDSSRNELKRVSTSVPGR